MHKLLIKPTQDAFMIAYDQVDTETNLNWGTAGPTNSMCNWTPGNSAFSSPKTPICKSSFSGP